MKQNYRFFTSLLLLVVILFSSFLSITMIDVNAIPLSGYKSGNSGTPSAKGSGSNSGGLVIPNCVVTVTPTGNASKINIDGVSYTRGNPDRTYYPGDAFDFQIQVHWTKWCYVIHPYGIIGDGLTLSGIQRGPTTCDDQGDCGFMEWGHAEIGPSTYGALLHQLVGAYGLLCSWTPDKGGTCHLGTTSGYGAYNPPIIKPQVYIKLKFENFTDRDGYKMRNNDGTYYVWDGINIIFNPDYTWKDARFRTLDTHTTAKSDISQIGYYECHDRSCPYTFSVPAIKPWSYNFGYEEGHTAFNSTSFGDIHNHIFYYHTDLYNLGRKIGEGDNTTKALVVQYKPVYKNYPYPVLKDNNWFGFGDRPGVALHYFGSVGGGTDDGTNVVHPDRRSKINGFDYDSHVSKEFQIHILNETMTWSEADQVMINNKTDTSFLTGNKNAEFVYAGYGKILFIHPILHTILETRYENATIDNTLESHNFAGYDVIGISSYTYVYPSVKFNTDVIVIVRHQDGSINNVPVSLNMTPKFDMGAEYTQQYVHDKVAYDLQDSNMGDVVVSDMYGKNNTISGTGSINLQANLVSTYFPRYTKLMSDNIFDFPLNYGYDAIAPYNLDITANGVHNTIEESSLNFYANHKYIINIDNNNVLNAHRVGNTISVLPDDNFGQYSKLTMDSKPINQICNVGCSILATDTSNSASVIAYNIWGGTATYNGPPAQITTSSPIDLGKLATIAVIAGIAFVGIKYGRRLLNGITGDDTVSAESSQSTPSSSDEE